MEVVLYLKGKKWFVVKNLVFQVLVLVTLAGVSRAYCVHSQGMASFGQSSVLKYEALSWHTVSL